ncbi:MAG: hypothetical protein KGQ47_07590, partial [Hyphomicrobiales bacterium]|nr:hypothetical protein [Hyphomicrobiales bacterium]
MLSGPLVYDNNNFTIGSLYVAPGVVFDIVGGSLTVLGAVDDEGTILVTGDPPALKIEGPLTIGSSGHLRVSGAGDIVEIDGNADNSGVIAATHRGKIVFDHSDLTNEGTLKADDRGTIKIKHSTVENTGKIEAKDNGTVTFDDADVHNNGHHAKIVASAGGSIDFAWDSSVINSHKALIEAKDGGTVWFGGATVVNKHQGTIEAADCGLVVFCGVSDLINKSGGKILAEDHGAVKFANSSVANDGGTIAAFGWGAKIELADTFIGGGTLKTDNGGVIETVYGCSTLDGVTIGCNSYLLVDACTTLTLSGGTTMDAGTLCIGCHGTLDIETCQGAMLDGVAVWNRGTIDVGESGRATLTLADGTSIHDGTLCIGCHGTLDIETCQGASLDGVTVWNRGDIQVDDSRPATLTLADGTAIHDGTLCIGCHGTVDIATCQGATLDGVTVWNSGQIQVGDWHPATLKLRGDTSIGGDGTFSVGGGSTVIADENTAVSIAAFIIDNCGTIEASYSAALTLATSDSFSNDGTIEATGNGSRIDIAASADGDTVQNGGTIEATNHATINFQHPAGQPTLTIDNNGGTIEAIGDGATVALHHVTVDNTDGGANDGVIKAGGTSTVELFNGTDIIGGTISAFGSGVVEITAGHTGANVTFDGSETASGSIIQPLTINGAGDIQVDPDTSLTLQGTIANHGTIDVGDGSGGASLIIDATGGGVKLTGSGDIILAGDSQIEGNGTHHSPDTLENVNNTISGAGAIGDGSGDLTLINDANGPIDATGMLTIETGNKAITNTGTLEATGPTGHLIVASAVTGTGSVDIGNGAVVEFESTVSSHQTVTFSGGGYGELIIDDGAGFSGKIAGFTGTAADSPSLATTDEIDVTNIDYTSDSFTEHYNSVTGVLKISDGTTTAKLTFVDFTGTFQFATDGSNGTLIFDPPAANSASPSASQANDSFVFNTNANSGNTGASWDAGAHDHTDWAHTQREWSQIAGDMNGAPAAPEIAQHAE